MRTFDFPFDSRGQIQAKSDHALWLRLERSLTSASILGKNGESLLFYRTG